MSQLQGTLSNFIERTRRYLREPDPNKSHWTDDFLKQAFNTNYRRRSAQLIMAHEGFFSIVATTDLIANQERYAWPVGFSRLLKIELVRDDGRTVPIERFERHKDVKQPPQSGGDTYRPTYRPIGSGFVLEPGPLEARAGGIRLEYNGTPAELTAPGDKLHSDFPAIFDELLVLDTTMTAFQQEAMQETGQATPIIHLQKEWEWDWERYIDQRLVSTQQVTPFVAHYHDA